MSNPAKRRVLTGIKPTGVPHLGNYLGAIRPAIELTKDHEAFLFIADLHALTIQPDPATLAEETYCVAASWIAFGLDPARVVFYRQSDIPEIPELAWFLSCLMPLGLLNRAHSFKDVLQNKGVSADEVNLGLYSYPVLMAADILLFDTDEVPVGKDQKQHLEIAQEAARKFNHVYGEVLKVPEPRIDERVMTIPGLDGEKMSKSKNNTITLFVPDKQLTKTVKQIKTDSTAYGQPLEPKGDTVFALYDLLGEPAQTAQLRARYGSGRKDPTLADDSQADPTANYFGWGDAKTALAELLKDRFAETRAEYARLMDDRAYLDGLLKDGAQRARTVAQGVLNRVREATGIRR